MLTVLVLAGAAAWFQDSSGKAGPGDLPGLVATYRDGERRIQLVAPHPHFYLEAGESLHPALGLSFEAEWNGALDVLQAGEYRFSSSAPAQIILGGRPVQPGPVRLDPGRHPIRITFRREAGPVQFQVTWQSDHFEEEPIPGSILWHRAEQSPRQEEAEVEEGRRLVEDFGCTNCHRSASPALKARPGPDLSRLAERVQPAWILPWLENPQSFKESAVMPVLLDTRQRLDVARYLTTLGPSSPAPEERASSEEIYDGHHLFNSIGCMACHGDGLPGAASKWRVSALATYLFDPRPVEPSGLMPGFGLSEQEAFLIASYLTDDNKTTGARTAAFEAPWEGGDAARGKALVESSGCLSCHRLQAPDPPANRHRAPKWEELEVRKGCLAEPPGDSVPRFAFKAGQRRAIESFLQSYRRQPDRSPAPVYQLSQDIRRLGCNSCHEVDHWRAGAALAEAPPALTAVGAKLKTGWLADVISGTARVQSGLELRMPGYGRERAAALSVALAKAAGAEPGAGPLPGEIPGEGVELGRSLLGMSPEKGGLACIACHDWGEKPSLGEPGPQLINAAERLRYDWFVRWMRAPSRILSGTSMPGFFSFQPAPEAALKIDALWAALRRGDQLPVPEGLEAAGAFPDENRPVPGDEAVTIRVDMPEASPAPVAVGLPGGVSYCFDTAVCRLLYAWQGGFIDMSPTLLRKTAPGTRISSVAEILGQVFYRPQEAPLQTGDRSAGCDFRGYRLIDGHPEFHYRLGDLDIRERIVPTPARDGLIRRFRVEEVRGPAWLLLEPAGEVELSSSLGAGEGGRLPLPQGRNLEFTLTVRRTGGQR